MRALLAIFMLLIAKAALADQSGQTDAWKLEQIRGQNSAVLVSTPAGGFGRKTKQKLVLNCVGSGYITSLGIIAIRSPVSVRYKFGERYDQAPVFTESWNLTKNRRAVIIGSQNFLNGLRSGKDFFVEITDRRGMTYMSWFTNSTSPIVDFVLGGCR